MLALHRPLGRWVEYHDPVPKSRGGRTTVPIHPICPRTLHTSLSNKELERIGADVASRRAQEDIARFLAWVAGKAPDCQASTRAKRVSLPGTGTR